MTTLIADLETDGLLDTVTKLHMIQLGDADGDDVEVYADWPGCKPIAEGLDRIRNATRVVFHNGIGFDAHIMRRFAPGVLNEARMLDTLVMARLSDPEERSHSLRAWGERLGLHKGNYKGDWQAIDQSMVDYARQDVAVGRALWHRVKHVLEWGTSARLEHEVAWIMQAQEVNGFCLDLPKAQALEADLRQEIAELDRQLQAAFPPIPREAKFTPKASNRKLGYQKGVEFTRVWSETFNASSRQQIGARLVSMGWKPRAFGADGHPTVDEKTLARLSTPGAKLLVQRFGAEKLLGQISDGKAGWLKLVKPTGRVHGRVNSNGAVTGRMSHSGPNMAQVSKDPRARAVWVPRPGWKLVGIDAEGIEARMLAHYLARYDGGAFTEIILNGRKEDGTDIHTRNANAVQRAGFKVNRDGSKTLLYALVYGAGDVKLGLTVRENLSSQGLPVPKLPPRETGALVRAGLSRSMVGIDKLSRDILAAIKERGYLKGLDGRQVHVRSSHAALNTLLQGAGAIAMKQALVLFMDSAVVHESWPAMGLCATVHDEVQIECEPEFAEAVGSTFADCIRLAGEALGVRCPLAGAYAVGNNWSETH